MFVRSIGLTDENIKGKQFMTNINRLRDMYLIPDWSRDYVEFALSTGLMKGSSANTFGAGQDTERQQVAVMTERLIENKEEIINAAASVSKAGTVKPVEKTVKNPENLMVLVNKVNIVPQGFVPADLTVPSIPFAFQGSSPKQLMRKTAAQAIVDLFTLAQKDNIKLYGVSGYRSFQTQSDIYYSKASRMGEEAAGAFSAKPGQSEHQTGLAMDVSSDSVGRSLVQSFGDTKEGKWLRLHAHEAGFIIRYPKGSEEITGYQYEPWHIRYVGKAAAKEIYEKNLTLEEYLQERK